MHIASRFYINIYIFISSRFRFVDWLVVRSDRILRWRFSSRIFRKVVRARISWNITRKAHQSTSKIIMHGNRPRNLRVNYSKCCITSFNFANEICKFWKHSYFPLRYLQVHSRRVIERSIRNLIENTHCCGRIPFSLSPFGVNPSSGTRTDSTTPIVS